jgi:hypothetical protein
MDVQRVGLSQEIDIEAGRLDLEAWSHPEGLESLRDNVRKIERLIAERLELLLRAT